MLAKLPSGTAQSIAKPTVIIGDSIDFLVGEHDRQQRLCDMLVGLALNPYHAGYQENAETAATYLTKDHPLHVVEEEVDLFTLLGRRSSDGDTLDRLFRQLAEGHEAESRLAARLVGELWCLAASQDPSDKAQFIADAFDLEEILRRHLGWEEHKVIPLARDRLSGIDRQQLAMRFAARRGASCAPAKVA